MLGFTEEINPRDQKAMVFNVHVSEISTWPLKKKKKNRLHFVLRFFNEVPVFLRNLNPCWVIAQLLTLLSPCSLGTINSSWYML